MINSLDSLCLADFVIFYSFSKWHSGTRQYIDDADDMETPNASQQLVYALCDASGFVKMRYTPNVIR